MKSIILRGVGIFALVVLAVIAAWLLTKPDIQTNIGEVVAPPIISTTPIAFVSDEVENPVFVTFGTSTALLNGIGYNNVLLTQVEAASGAKYEASSENLTLWNKGDEVVINRGRKVIFTGVNKDTYLPSDAATSTVDVATTSESTTVSGTYIWTETKRGDQSIVPKTPEAFTVTFLEDTVSGTTDCNGFTGSYERVDDTITIGALATTKKFCEDSQEQEFVQQFIGSLTVRTSGTTLTLTHVDGTVSNFEAKQ